MFEKISYIHTYYACPNVNKNKIYANSQRILVFQILEQNPSPIDSTYAIFLLFLVHQIWLKAHTCPTLVKTSKPKLALG